jgi:hypothetical protein
MSSANFSAVRNYSGKNLDVRSTLLHLGFRRRAARIFALGITGASCLFTLLLLIGAADYVLHLRRNLRVSLVVLLIFGIIALSIYSAFALIRRRRFLESARDVERAAGGKHNALVTFAESLEQLTRLRVAPYMFTRLEAQARRDLETIDLNVVTPRRPFVRSTGLLILMFTLLLATRIFVPTVFARETRRILWLEPDEISTRKVDAGNVTGSGNNIVFVENFRVRVLPPAYSGLELEEAVGDEPLRVLSGSQIEVDLTVRGKFRLATLGFGGVTNALRAVDQGRYSGSFIANASGAFEAQVTSVSSYPPVSIVRAIDVYTDSPPDARITSPAKDELLQAVPANPVVVRWIANDDLGLASVVLKYIRSRGEGDSAQFVSGTMPLAAIERTNPREWNGGATISLQRLGLQPGDTLVYWIEARDRNPSANNVGRSASLAIAITRPEPVKLNLGDLGPTEIGRFLLSQRAIIIHTETLHGKRSRLSREDFLQRANDIAAEQRDFKNSFNEYMKVEGDESRTATSLAPESIEERVREADEERTGVHMHGIPEPPSGSPSNVRDMVYAIRAMWDAEASLSTGDTAQALVYEREALTRLKRAQLAVRYVPPVFAISKPVDLKRRYAGELNEIKSRLERIQRAPESKDAISLRQALSSAYSALADLNSTIEMPIATRPESIARARSRAQQAADNLTTIGGDHASTIAEALGQLRIVDSELSSLNPDGNADDYATRVSKSLALLTKATGNLFAIAEARTRANGGAMNAVFPTDDRRTSEYFRRLNK